MAHHSFDRHAAAAEPRSLTDILADARDLQSSHAPRLLGGAASWLRGRLTPRADGSLELPRRLVIH